MIISNFGYIVTLVNGLFTAVRNGIAQTSHLSQLVFKTPRLKVCAVYLP